MIGQLDVLHQSKGHETLQFKSKKQAKEEIDKYLKKGFSILLDVKGGSKKATGFDQKTGEYLVKETRQVEETLRYPLATTKATAVAPTGGG